MLEAERATRQSWPNSKPLPAQHSQLSLQRSFTDQEYKQICLGLIPETMEDKWFMFTEDDTLYIHRSWTGSCIYQLTFIKEGSSYVVSQALANRDESQYSRGYDSYDEKMLMFLIDYFLLKQSPPLPHPMPVPPDFPAGIGTELHYHHVLGAGQKAKAETIHLTIGGMLGWLWRWLLWLIKR